MALLHLRTAHRGVCPAFPHEAGDTVLVFGDADQQVVMRTRLGARAPRTFRLEWRNASAGAQYELDRLFRAAGGVKAMNYVPPDETAIVEVRFVEGTLTITQNSVNDYRMSVEVEEVLR